ncbi:MAG TPA: thiamine-phosphate kinase [Ktedonobacterales bacterium]|nr:thiamine-phosphate kinase [Ktedonobacterales bacterium]
MRLEDLGEFGLIARLTSNLETRPDVALGIGDDAALLDPGPDMLVAVTVDALIAGRHFLMAVSTPEEIGRKALAVNLSDLAAMGAEPCWALVSLMLPASLEVGVLDGMYAGLRSEAQRYGVALVGGNVTATDGPLTIDVMALGRCPRGMQVTRAGGRPGDLLVVTDSLGAGVAGLLVAREPERAGGLAQSLLQQARGAMVSPIPRVEAGRALASGRLATAMIDISDGLTSDLNHLCESSGVGAELDASLIPVNPVAAEIAVHYGRDPLALALNGGDDYELLCAIAPERRDETLAVLRAVGCAPAVIGRLTAPGSGMTLRRADGSTEPLAPRGWDHLIPGRLV